MSDEKKNGYAISSGYEQMGELIREWAKFPALRPTSIDDLKELFLERGIGVYISKDITELNIYDYPNPSKTLSIRVPSKDMLEEPKEQQKGSQIPYPLPEFYSEAFGSAPCQKTKGDKKFRNQRIGEYSMQKCG